MWRFQSTHERKDTEYLDQAIGRIEADGHLYGRAEALLSSAGSMEPLISESLSTPQDIRYHAEGPFVHDHLRQMLMGLYALNEEKLHLIDIEEFRRLKGYEGEIEEMEEMIKENFALFEVFTLVHDAAKAPTMFFTARAKSRGAELGFTMDRIHNFDEGHAQRLVLRDKYMELFREFENNHPDLSSRELQTQFFLTYEIEVHYPQHARKIHAPVYEALLDRLSMAHRLQPRDRNLLDELIAHHMEFNLAFKTVSPKQIGRFIHLSQRHGFDGDDFIDLMQGCIFLDMIVGSKQLSAHGWWHDSSPIVNCLRSEHEFAPWLRVQKLQKRDVYERRERNKVFKEVGLDGLAMMDLLNMDPGPDFGITLRRVHAGVLGQGEMPRFGKLIDHELSDRATAFYSHVFRKGE